MSFHLSAQDIRIEDNHLLVADLQDASGEFQCASIDLNEFLGNNNGSFEWDGENFSETAEDVEFAIEGDGEVPVLRAMLRNEEGEMVPADVNLAERVVNEDGAFVFQ
ncbi:Cyanovirin-N [Aspergillus egyptiacus]|nr:Cyanovirin-N [Aspergillus egyptiacus]